LPASAFFGAGVLLAVDVLVAVAFFVGADFVAVDLDLVVLAFVAAVFVGLGFAAIALGLAAGLFWERQPKSRIGNSYDLVTSLAAEVSAALVLGASLTRPEGP